MPRVLAAATLVAAMGFVATTQAQYLIVGNDEKVAFNDGKPVLSPPGKDTVSIIDIRDRANPRIVVNLPLENSVFGPPTNLAVTPDGKLALVANSVDVVKDGDTLKSVPDNKLFVIDLTPSPPAVMDPNRQAAFRPSDQSRGKFRARCQSCGQQRERLVDFRKDRRPRRHSGARACRRAQPATIGRGHHARRQARWWPRRRRTRSPSSISTVLP